MTASNAAGTGTPMNMVTAALRALREKLTMSLPRWIILAVGLACIIYSQFLLEHRQPVGTINPRAEELNVVYRLAIINYDNLYAALPYFFTGALLCFLTITPVSWKQDLLNWASTWPTAMQAKWKSQAIPLMIGAVIFAGLIYQLSRHHYSAIYLVFWLAAILIFTSVLWKWDRNANVDLSIGFTATDLFWLSGLLILGFGISAFALNDIPMVMVPDEGNFWETARAIAIGDLHPVFFDSGVYTFPVASSILQGWLVRLFGVSFWSWRFSSVVAGVFAIIPLYLLTKEWFGRTTAIVACIMMAANPYFISFNRLGYNNSQSLFPVALGMYFFALSARKGSYFYLWLTGLTIGLGFYTYFSAWIGLVTLVLVVLYLLITRAIHFKKALAILAITIAAWAVMFLPRIAYTSSGPDSSGLIFKIFETSFVNVFYGKAYYGESDLTRVSPYITIGEQHTLFYEPQIYWELIVRGAVRTFFANFDPYIVAEHFLNTGFSGVITPVFFLAGLALALRRARQLRFGLPLIWFFASMIFLSVFNAFPPRHTHLVAVIPALALISAAGFTALIENLMEIIPAGAFKGTMRILLISVAALAIVQYGFQRYFVDMPKAYAPPFEDVASWLTWKTAKPVQIVYLSDEMRPHRVEYLINTHMANHRYLSGLIDDFVPEGLLSGKEPAIIFVDTLRTDNLPIIDNPPAGFRTLVQYFHQDGYSIGYALTNTNIDLDPKVGVEDGWNSLLKMPVRSMLLFLMIPLVIGLTGILRSWAGWSQEDVLLELNIGPSKRDPASGLERSGEGKFEFHLQIRIPARKQNNLDKTTKS